MLHDKNYRWEHDELFEAMKESYHRLETSLGRPPKGGEVIDDLGTTWKVITRVIGGWSNFLQLLGKWEGGGSIPFQHISDAKENDPDSKIHYFQIRNAGSLASRKRRKMRKKK